MKAPIIVFDSWWPWRMGRVVKVLKTRIHVEFADGVHVYDKAHVKFLRRVK